MVFIYLFVSRLIREEQDDALAKSLQRIRTHLQREHTLPNLPPVQETTLLPGRVAPFLQLSDTLVYDPVEGEEEAFRQLQATAEVEGQYYSIRLRVPRLEAHDLMPAVGLPAAILLLLLFGGLYWLNRNALRQIWQPFYGTLAALKKFSIAQPHTLRLEASGIEEFDEMNGVVVQLAEQTRTDYRNLKEFTENAAHEIQTPLAIIRSKAEWLMQCGKWTPEQAKAVAAVYQAVNRLSKLNQGLILLSRIENRQFIATGPLALNTVIREQVALLDELISAKKFRVHIDCPADMAVRIHPVLAELLVKNLLENALRYSPPGSAVSIRADPGRLVFSNPGEEALGGHETLFRRFAARSRPSESPGLGLAIAHKICEISGFQIDYSFTEGQHQFALIIPEKSQNLP